MVSPFNSINFTPLGFTENSAISVVAHLNLINCLACIAVSHPLTELVLLLPKIIPPFPPPNPLSYLINCPSLKLDGITLISVFNKLYVEFVSKSI